MRKTKKTLAILAIVAMVLAMIPVQVFAATTSAADSDRYAGADRIATALEVAANWTSANAVVLAPADDANLVDALAAAPLAGQDNAPILLTYKDGLNADVKAKIAALGAKKVYVIGALAGNAALVSEVDAISGVTAESLSGADRWATAAAINAKLTNVAGTFVVGYDAIPDALSAASFAAANKYQIALTNVDGSVDASRLAGSKTYLVGGTGVVKDYAGATRFGGADRYLTNEAVVKGLTYEFSKVYIANGETLVDALVAAPLAAKDNAAVLLANTSVAGASYVNGKLGSTSKVIALGGTGVVSDAVKAGVAYQAPAVLSVESVSAINLNQIKVVFTKAVDQTEAEDTAYYMLDGATLGGNDKAVLQSDKQTVLITLDSAKNQYATAHFTVKKAILSDNLLETAPQYETDLTFSDVAVPTVASVAATGNKKVTVTFSEPVVITVADANNFKINDQSVVNYSFTSATVKNPTGTTNYASAIDLDFASALPVGTNTLTVPAGTGTSLHDAANFMVAKTTVNFNVNNVTTAPTVTSVTGQNNGTVYVTFDRAMSDATTGSGALTLANYNLGGTTPATNPTAATFKDGTGNTVVKLTFAANVVAKGVNVLVIDKDIVDTYGNVIDKNNDYRASFTATEDTTAPTVASVTLLSSTKIRVKFSETVNNTYAVNINNYTLKDSAGSNVSGNISGIAAVPTPGQNSDTYDITLSAGVNGSGYTLTIKNIVDLAATPNAMADYTATVNGTDTVAPSVSVAVAVYGSTNKVAIYFSEAMNAASVTNKANYAFIDGTTATNALPSNASIAAAGDNKSVTITFPTTYTVNATGGTTAMDVNSIRIANVTDVAGNVLKTIAVVQDIVPVTDTDAVALASSMSAKTFKLYYTGDNVTAEVSYSKTISTLNMADFTVAGVAPDSGYLSGNKVVLTFSTPASVTAIKTAGTTAALVTIAAPNSADASGIKIKVSDSQTVYNYELAPKVASVSASSTAQTVSVVFDSSVDGTIAGLYKDDFTFVDTTTGTVLTPVSVTVTGGTSVDFQFDPTTIVSGHDISIKANNANISIKGLEDGAGNQTSYAPSTTDLNGRSATAS